jgi:hypothetical protein
MYILINPCLYSFQDLLKAAGKNEDTTEIYRMTQQHRNNEVKMLCGSAGWYWCDIIKNNVTYTSFSPEKK